eukprot:TRINITY_DN33405_c0_g1_i1.p1 TRINITY_DN33405_c0_g1~~TRINITY_DN33405_c0_g1_i1.p1  ORF type:complete len:191 (+),score=49.99 TRINITY_DN33405_c0_g1_i1:188-760(+)
MENVREETKLKIEQTILEILRSADMSEMTEYKVRKKAEEELGINLSVPPYKKFVRDIIERFLSEEANEYEEKESADKNEEEEEEAVQEEEEEEKPRKRSKKENFSSRTDSEKLQKTSTDEEGNTVVCKLSGKRNVTVSAFKGNKLVSIREYWYKDGKQLPTSKGISLTIDQWEALKSGLPAIEKVINDLQ